MYKINAVTVSIEQICEENSHSNYYVILDT